MDSEPKELFGAWEVELSTPQQGTILTLLTCLMDNVWRAQQSTPLWQSANHHNGVGGVWGEVTYTCAVRVRNQMGQPAGQLKVEGALQFHPTTLSWQGPFQLDVVDADGQVHLAERGTFKSRRVEQEL
ncbi:MAG: hypothetical protein U0350_25185 [Caldilineaceae bacterium]